MAKPVQHAHLESSPAPAPAPAPSVSSTPPIARLHVWQIQAVRDVLLVAAVFGLVWAGYAMRTVTVPLLVALGLAYLFEPLVARLTRNPKTSRPMIVGGLILTVGLSLVLLLMVTMPLVVSQSVQLVDSVRAGRFEGTLLRLKEILPENYRDNYQQMMNWLGAEPKDRVAEPESHGATSKPAPATEPAAKSVQSEQHVREIIREELAAAGLSQPAPANSSSTWLSFVRSGGKTLLEFLGTVFSFSLLAFLIPFYFFFFSVSYPAVVRFGRSLIPVANRTRVLELIGKMDRAVAGFVRGRIVISLIMGVMLAIGWMIVGVPYSIVLGFLVGMFNIVPYLGGLGIPLSVGFLVVDQLQLSPDQRMSWWAIVVAPTAVYLVIGAIEAYILTPLIAGKATNLDPVTILVAVLAGGSVGGIYGMLLAIPVAACLKILCTDVLLPRVRSWTKGEIDDPLPIARE